MTSPCPFDPPRLARDANQGTEFGQPLARVCGQIEDDREALEKIIDDVGVGRSRIKPMIGWIGERLGRLKPNGQLRAARLL